jgi:hypothetical protein
VLSQFDPRGGVSDPVLRMLNGLGFGTFYGSGDRLGIKGVTAAGQGQGLDAHDFSGDFIQGYNSSTPYWTYDAYQDPFTTAAEPPPTTPGGGSDGGASGGISAEQLVQILSAQQPAAASGMDPAMSAALMAALNQMAAPPAQPDNPTVVPSLAASEGGSPVGRALQLMAMHMNHGGGSGPQGPSDPLTAWLMSILGQGGTA